MSTTTNQSSKVYYTAKTHTTGGREGASQSSDGNLDVKLSLPGSNKPGTNPEQLFADHLPLPHSTLPLPA